MIWYEELTQQIVGAAMEVHKESGPGLLESCYEAMLCHELTQRGLSFRRQVDLPLKYKGSLLDCGYRLDLIVEEKVIVEIKSVERMIPLFEAQLLTYLKLSGYRVGLLINFNVQLLKDGLTRRIL